MNKAELRAQYEEADQIHEISQEEMVRIPEEKEIDMRRMICQDCPNFEEIKMRTLTLPACRACKTCKGKPRKIVFNAPRRVFYCPENQWDGSLKTYKGSLLMVMRRVGYRTKYTHSVLTHLRSKGFIVDKVEGPEILQNPNGFLSQAEKKYDAVLIWDEHGRLFRSVKFAKFVNACYRAGAVPMSLDFGYFDHYKSFFLDEYCHDGQGRIKEKWDSINVDVKPNSRIDRFFKQMDELKEKALKAGPIIEQPYTCLWAQFSTTLAKNEFRIRDNNEWINKTLKHIRDNGKNAVLKLCPLKRAWDSYAKSVPNMDGVFTGKDRFQNARLALFSENNILSNTGVTNELALLGVPVTVLGDSWFNGLDVFHEPKTWEEVGPAAPINVEARKRWIAYWIENQSYLEEVTDRILQLTQEGQSRLSGGLSIALDKKVHRKKKGYKIEGFTGDCVLPEKEFMLTLLPTSGTMIEIGTWHGVTAAWFAKSLPNLRIISVDPLVRKEHLKRWTENAHHNQTLIQKKSMDTVEELSGQEYEAILIDGDHSEEAVYEELINYAPLVTRTGRIFLHDYGDDFTPGVALAVNRFVEDANWKIYKQDQSLVVLIRGRRSK